MKIKHYLLVIVTFALVLSGIGCGGGSTPPITLTTEYGTGYKGFGQTMIDPQVYLNVTYDTSSDLCSAQGSNLKSGYTNNSGNLSFNGACSTLDIIVARTESINCQYAGNNGVFIYDEFGVSNGSSTPLPCGNPYVGLVISPVSAPSNFIPAEIQMTAGPGTFVSTYGMPTISYTDETGIIAGNVTADNIASDGSWITFPTTPLLRPQNTAIPGPYIVFAYNIDVPGQMVSGTSSEGDIIAVAPQPVGGAIFTVDPLVTPRPCPAIDLTGNEDCNQPCPEVFIIGGEGGCNLPTSPGPLSFLEPKVPFDFKPDTSVASWSS